MSDKFFSIPHLHGRNAAFYPSPLALLDGLYILFRFTADEVRDLIHWHFIQLTAMLSDTSYTTISVTGRESRLPHAYH